ncbi:glycerate dehydrogenase [Lachnospiraceae bacterium XBB1006]|nr:glycerate dehydrogenase [Lachnospiraceae bacterium XBB1006]
MNIVVLERNSVGTDIDVNYEDLGTVTYYENTVTEEEVAARVMDADIIIGNKAPLNEASLKNASRVKLITVFATGYDNVDLAYCTKRGILVENIVNYSTAMVAQHTFTLALSLYEKLPHYDHYVKSGAYASQSRFSNFDIPFHEFDGKTWGIIGMGNIGKRVAQIASAFGANVIFYSVTGKSTVTEYPQVDFDTLLKESDILSLHCPLSDLTRNLIDYAALCKMKNSALLINVARGPIVNNHDLARALQEGILQGAGLDVLEKEPITTDNPLSAIKDSNKLIITPHLAWASVEARIRCVEEVRENIKAFLKGEERNVVNPRTPASSSFFANTACKYYPCHEGIREMNCLFCYCPMYRFEHCLGSPNYIERNGKRIKDCTHCTYPHEASHYDAIMNKLRENLSY